ncbi:hypothetical protein [Sphingosinicella microcystinivorans]|uniref:hypothetical protein n=1 Tax=Sphingosinicella microcystinivorans TaxID=335406 RepID=UPI0022F3DD69|nr:hypothetical protein [Sphingosinicella microcystinivorans]WBX83014.1 hypothetical protein PE061_14500 [Sphingosinicella microcystinivorans]
MGELVLFPARDRGQILIRKEDDGQYFIEHEGPGGGSYGAWARVETFEQAQVSADIASAHYGGLPIVGYL